MRSHWLKLIFQGLLLIFAVQMLYDGWVQPTDGIRAILAAGRGKKAFPTYL